MRWALAVALATGAFAGSASAGAPLIPHGRPVAVYVQVRPALSWFGDPVNVRVNAFVDHARVRPESVHATVHVAPFKPVDTVGRPARTEFGSVTRLTWNLELQCLTQPCISAAKCQGPPCIQAPTKKFPLGSGRLVYELRQPPHSRRSLPFRGTSIVVASPVVATPFDKSNLQPTIYRYHLWPLASPRYRLSPWLAAGLSGGIAAALAAVAALMLWRLRRRRRAAQAPKAEPVASPVEQALAALAWATTQGDEAQRRKALERLAGEIETLDGLADVALRLAWSETTPEREEMSGLAHRVRAAAKT